MKKDLKIEDLQQKRLKLEQDIYLLIDNFLHETEGCISGIELIILKGNDVQGKYPVIIDVNVKLEL